MSMIRITFTAHDNIKLDRAVSDVARAIPADACQDVEIMLAPKIGGFQIRKMWLHEPNDRVVGLLGRVDAPKDVELSIKQY